VPGESRVEIAEAIMRATTLITELVAGTVAESVLHPDHEELAAPNDVEEAAALAKRLHWMLMR
jgi:hypothetical protein